MRLIFGSLYALLFFSYILTAAFIVFHIIRFSFKKSIALFGLVLFLTVFSVLIFTNVMIFFSLPIETMIPRSF